MYEGAPDHLNDEVTVWFGNTFKTMVVKEIIPTKKNIWNVVDSFIDSKELKK